ncbi:MAG: ATP-binding protein [Patescibacteria group bacterium]
MAQKSIYFEGITAETDEFKRQSRMLTIYSAVLMTLILTYGVFRLLNGLWASGSAEIVLGTGLAVNYLLFLKHRNLTYAKPAISLVTLIVSIVILVSGGTNGTAIYWANTFPSLIFLLQGIRVGLIHNIIFFASHIAFALAVQAGMVESYYTFNQLQQSWVTMLMLNILGYIAESGWEKSRRTIEAQRERLRTLLADLPVGVIMVAADGTPLAANDSVKIIFGRPILPTIKAKDFAEAYHISKENGQPLTTDEMPTLAALTTGKPVIRTGLFVTRPDGSVTVIRVSAAPIIDAKGKVTAVVAVYEDMTKEHEIDQIKSEFVSLASHQLKTPLTAIKWTVESLLDGADTMTANQKQMLADMDTTAERLNRLVSDLLNVSRIETGRKFNIVKKPTDIAAVIRKAAAEASVVAAKRQVVIDASKLPDDLICDVDEAKIHEVFANIIGNAVKYSSEAGRVEIGVSATDQRGPTIYVKDGGIGIPKTQQAKVFQRFFRASNVEADIEGTGLGLYIVRAIVEKHGGRVWFESEEGFDTTFFVALPAVAPTPAADDPAVAPKT